MEHFSIGKLENLMIAMTESKITISIVEEFTRYPGPRFKWQGENSGEEFFQSFLRPKYLEAVEKNLTLEIDLDGTEGYSSAFLDGSFGELSREFGKSKVIKVLSFISIDEPFLIDEIRFYMEQ